MFQRGLTCDQRRFLEEKRKGSGSEISRPGMSKRYCGKMGKGGNIDKDERTAQKRERNRQKGGCEHHDAKKCLQYNPSTSLCKPQHSPEIRAHKKITRVETDFLLIHSRERTAQKELECLELTDGRSRD
jgi:hypothetical protein